jgi:hypothetical protein
LGVFSKGVTKWDADSRATKQLSSRDPGFLAVYNQRKTRRKLSKIYHVPENWLFFGPEHARQSALCNHQNDNTSAWQKKKKINK